jgi:hypothetical protein
MTVELLLFLILLILVVAVLPKLVGWVLKALVMLCALIGAFVVLVALLA